MEVCGSHTMAIFRNGIRSILPDGSNSMLRPGLPGLRYLGVTHGCLHRHGRQARGAGGDIRRSVPGPRQQWLIGQCQFARGQGRYCLFSDGCPGPGRKNPQDLVVFLGVGFETTTPTIAATILAARNRNISNFRRVFNSKNRSCSAFRPARRPGTQAQRSALSRPRLGHHRRRGLCPVRGETSDRLRHCRIRNHRSPHQSDTAGATDRSRRGEGRECLRPGGLLGRQCRAKQMVEEIFEPCDTQWRGLGLIPGSGLKIREKYRDFDAEARLDITLAPAGEPKGCMCGNILKGINNPRQCALFGTRCTPASPVGPCMVSSEGTCAAFHKYGLDM